ncbi:MAG: ArsA family ATPase [Bdellovibrionales bacterium]|nr:ArsA family ATPase [Bdellovibrionales bacterium]
MSQPSLFFITGKGGVGKSTTAALIAKHHANLGKRVLLVEIGDSSYYSMLFKKPIAFDPVEVSSNLFVSHWQWFRCLKEYVTHVIKIETVTNLFFENAVMKSIIQVAPGLPEIALLGKFTSSIRHVGPSMPYDIVVMDAHSTGHALSMLRAPKGLFETIGFGPLGDHSKGIHDTMMDSELVKYITVCLPEELPVTETVEFTETLKTEFKIESEVWLNKVLPIQADAETIDQWQETAATDDVKKAANYIQGQVQKQKTSFEILEKTDRLHKIIYYRSLDGEAINWLSNLEKESKDV